MERRRDSGRAAFARTVEEIFGFCLCEPCNEAIGYTPARSSRRLHDLGRLEMFDRNVMRRTRMHPVVRVDAGDGVRNFVKRLKSKSPISPP